MEDSSFTPVYDKSKTVSARFANPVDAFIDHIMNPNIRYSSQIAAALFTYTRQTNVGSINDCFIELSPNLLASLEVQRLCGKVTFLECQRKFKDILTLQATPLYLAAKYGCVHIATELINLGAHVNQAYAYHQNIISPSLKYIVEHASVPIVKNKDLDMLALFLQANMDTNPKMGLTDSTEVHKNMSYDNNTVSEYVPGEVPVGVTPLFDFMCENSWVDGIQMLLEYGMSPRISAWDGKKTLLYSLMKYNLSPDLVAKVFEMHEDMPLIALADGSPVPLLMCATLYKDVDVVRQVLQLPNYNLHWDDGSDSIISNIGRIPPGVTFPEALTACEESAIEIVNLFKEAGADLNTVVRSECILSQALRSRWDTLCRRLIELGVDMYGETNERNDMMYKFVTMPKRSAVACLLKCGYDISKMTFLPKKNSRGANPTYHHFIAFLIQQMTIIEAKSDITNAVGMFTKAFKNMVSTNADVGGDDSGISAYHYAIDCLWPRIDLFEPFAKVLLQYHFDMNKHSVEKFAHILLKLVRDAITMSEFNLDPKINLERIIEVVKGILRPLVNDGYDFDSVDRFNKNYLICQLEICDDSEKVIFQTVFNNLRIGEGFKSSAPMKAYRGAIFSSRADPHIVGVDASYRYFSDGLMVVQDGYIKAIGHYKDLESQYKDVPTTVYKPGELIMPGFIDNHIHMPQVNIIGAYGDQLLDWLKRYTFPNEAKFNDQEYANVQAKNFIHEMLKNGTTTALVFCSVHPESVEAFFEEAGRLNLRMIAGKVMMDRNCPPTLQDTAESSYTESKALIEKYHQTKRLLYAVTPRFAPTSTPEQLDMACKLLDEYEGLYMHTHISENPDEIEWVKSLFPYRKSYLDVYDFHGLLRPRSVLAHGVHLDHDDCSTISERECAVTFCPSSNLFLGSGLFSLKNMHDFNIRLGLGSDIGAGDRFCHLQTLNQAYKVCQLNKQSLGAFKGFYLATLSSARALYLDHCIGSLEVGKEADFVVMNLNAIDLLSFRSNMTNDIYQIIFTLMMLGDERCVSQVYSFGNLVFDQENDDYKMVDLTKPVPFKREEDSDDEDAAEFPTVSLKTSSTQIYKSNA